MPDEKEVLNKHFTENLFYDSFDEEGRVVQGLRGTELNSGNSPQIL